MQKAEADLELAGQDIGASTEQVAVAEAHLSEACTQLAHYQFQAERYLMLAEKGYYAKAGTPLMTFVSFNNFWIQANIRENRVVLKNYCSH